jgi:hypothetical protein
VRQEHRQFIGNHQVRLLGKDSTGISARLVQQYGFFRYRSSDPDTTLAYYPTLYQTDLRGLRHYVSGYEAQHAIFLPLKLSKSGSKTQFSLEPGIQHDYYRIKTDAGDTVIQHLSARAQLLIQPLPGWTLQANGQLWFLGDNAGDYVLKATMKTALLNRYFSKSG